MKLMKTLALALAPTLFAQPDVLAAQENGAMPGEAMVDPAAELAILDARDIELDDFLWIARPLVIFADTPRDPRFILQMERIEARPGDLIERDVVVIIDTDPAARSAVRQKLRPNGFTFVLIDKDGTIILRKPQPWGTRELARAIDKTPLRQEEMEAEKELQHDALN